MNSLQTLDGGAKKPYFFSFIIPAHNEEKYLKRTLDAICDMNYPKDRFEVFVIENGSTDKTFTIAKTFERSHDNITAMISEPKGVSRARNLGMSKISPQSEWIISLDADTFLLPEFLNDLNAFFHRHERENLAIGTTKVLPLENKSWYAYAWMFVYNVGHRFTKTSLAIQVIKTEMREKAQFHQSLSLAEDLKFIKDLLPFGKFFYINTDTVLTSTRRFDEVGWLRLFITWNWDALVWNLSHHDKTATKEYKVIR